MTVALPRWLSRTAALALLALVLGGIYALVLEPVVTGYREGLAELQQEQSRIARFAAIAASADEVEAAARAAEARQAQSGVFIQGASDAQAAAALQSRINAVVRSAGGDLRSVQSLPPERGADDGASRIGVQLQYIGTIHDLRRLLYELETGTPLLFVEKLEMRGRLARRSRQDENLQIDPNFLITLSLRGERPGDAT